MEVDEQEASGSSSDSPSSIINLQGDTEPLPSVDLGSETWHDQVPAVSTFAVVTISIFLLKV